MPLLALATHDLRASAACLRRASQMRTVPSCLYDVNVKEAAIDPYLNYQPACSIVVYCHCLVIVRLHIVIVHFQSNAYELTLL